MGVQKNSFEMSPEAQQHLDQAYTYEDKEDFKNALRECELAIQLASDSAEPYNLRGIILEGLNRKEEAIAAYREAVRLDPEYRDAKENLSEIEIEFREETVAEVLSGDQDEGQIVKRLVKQGWSKESARQFISEIQQIVEQSSQTSSQTYNTQKENDHNYCFFCGLPNPDASGQLSYTKAGTERQRQRYGRHFAGKKYTIEVPYHSSCRKKYRTQIFSGMSVEELWDRWKEWSSIDPVAKEGYSLADIDRILIVVCPVCKSKNSPSNINCWRCEVNLSEALAKAQEKAEEQERVEKASKARSAKIFLIGLVLILGLPVIAGIFCMVFLIGKLMG